MFIKNESHIRITLILLLFLTVISIAGSRKSEIEPEFEPEFQKVRSLLVFRSSSEGGLSLSFTLPNTS